MSQHIPIPGYHPLPGTPPGFGPSFPDSPFRPAYPHNGVRVGVSVEIPLKDLGKLFSGLKPLQGLGALVFLACFCYVYYIVAMAGTFVLAKSMAITFCLWLLFACVFASTAGVTALSCLSVVATSLLFSVANLVVEYYVAQWMGLNMDGTDPGFPYGRHQGTEYMIKYCIMGATVALLDVLAIFFVCRGLPLSSGCLAFYGMLAANVIAHVTYMARHHLFNEIGAIPPLHPSQWTPAMWMSYACIVMPVIVCVGGVCGRVMTCQMVQMGGMLTGSGALVAFALPFALRLVANACVFAYEYYRTHMRMHGKEDGGFLQ